MSESNSSRLVSATMIMTAGTALSRVLGFVKAAMLVAALGGATRQADIFTFANVLPQMIYLLLAGGVLNTVFVPQIVRAMKNDPDGGEAYTNKLLTLAMSAILLITIVVTLLSPVIMSLYLDDQWRRPELSAQYDSLITLTYLCMPQVFFYGVNVMVGQVLNARGRFGPMMWSPIANNLVGIGSIILFLALWPGERDLGAPFSTGQLMVLGIGATLGIIVQALVLLPFLRTVGFRFRPRFDFRGSGLGHAAQIAKWTIGYMLVTQLALVVVARLASRATVGVDAEGAGWTVYQQANLIFMLPHSLITVSLATAMLPSTSRKVAEGDLAGARGETMQTMRLAVTALLPAAVAFIALGLPIANVLFGFGNGAERWQPIGWTLIAFAVGLVPFTLQYVCLRAFYALEDTRTTFLVQLLIAGVNVVGALALMQLFTDPNWVAVGLALAYSIAYLVGFGISFRLLARKLPGLSLREIGAHCLRVFLAVLPAGIVAYVISWVFSLWSTTLPSRVLALAVAGVVAVGLYLGLARILRIVEVNQIVSGVLRRRSGAATVDNDSGGDGAPGDPDEALPGSGSTPSTPAPIIDSYRSGGSEWEASPESGTIDARTVQVGTGQPGMTRSQSSQTEALSVDPEADETPAAAEPQHDPDQHDPDQTAQFTLAELEADDHPEDEPAEDDDPTGISPPDQLPAGAVLANRYRLEELLAWSGPITAERGDAFTWRAFDTVLSRSVVIHLLSVGDERGPALLAAGRRAAAATDSRFLRVLDAVPEGATDADGREIGSYIVSEYAEGQSLETLLQAAPLTGLEAAWVVRDVADAVAGAHARGLHHRRLHPEAVIITPSGNVRIVGLLIEAALRPEDYTGKSGEDDLIAADVSDLGRLLYACLVARWPGGPAYGLPAAPETGSPDDPHPWFTPRQVRHGVSPALDRICDQLLSPVPRQHADRILTAAELVTDLDRVLGSADASGDLERRLRHPEPRYLSEDADEEGGPPVRHETYALVERSGSIAAGTNSSSSPAQTGASSPTSADPETADRSGPRWWIFLLVVLLLLVAIVITVVTARGLGSAPPADEPSAAASAPAQTEPSPVEIVDASDFDPPPGNGEEHTEEVPNAYDGDPETRWRTMEYLGSPKLGNLKPGVGLVFDLGEARSVREVRVQLSGDDTDLQVRIPSEDPTGEDSADLNRLRNWDVVGKEKGAGDSATVTLDEPTETRYVLVFLTSLPREGGNYRGGIYEVEVLS